MSSMQLYFLTWATVHGSFRLPELESVAKLYNFTFHLPPFAPEVISAYQADGCGLDSEWDLEGRPVLVLGLDRPEDAAAIGARLVGGKSIHKLYHLAPSTAALNTLLRSQPPTPEARPWEAAIPAWDENSSEKPVRWRWRMESWGRGVDMEQQKTTLKTLSHLEMGGLIDLKTPDVELGIFEEFNSPTPGWSEVPRGVVIQSRLVFFGILVTHSLARPLITHYSLKTRAHIGNTSMDAEISLLMANQALSRPGALCWDPFVGTGSMLLTCAEWGSRVWGSDIDGRQMRGKKALKGMGAPPGIHRSAEQYGVQDRVVDLLTCDVTTFSRSRIGNMFDSIVTDPPYGVRAGAKRLGRKDQSKQKTQPFILPAHDVNAGIATHLLPDYLPPFRPYELVHLANDLVRLARYALKPGGRLVFFLPVATEDYTPVSVPRCQGMTLIANSVEDFGKWARRLITMERDLDSPSVPPPNFDSELLAPSDILPGRQEKPRDFRDRYFSGFKSEESR